MSRELQVGIIPGGRAGDKFKRHYNLVIDDQMMFNDIEEMMSEAMCSPNDSKDISAIMQRMKEGGIWAGWDSFGEGIVVFAPLGTAYDQMELEAYRTYNGGD